MFQKPKSVVVPLVLGMCLATLVFVGLQAAGDILARNDAAVGNQITYQGFLDDNGGPANGSYDFLFRLYDDLSAGTQVGVDVTLDDVPVTDGLFTVILDFGDVWDGTAVYLEARVRPGSDVGPYDTLSPRQSITPAPYAVYASHAPWTGLSGVPAGFADGVDDDTTYTAGSGLVLNSTQFSAAGSPFANVIVVAKSGGDFTSVQAALDSITDNSVNQRYLVWVAPGYYYEQVTMKPYVDIEGAGIDQTTIQYLSAQSTEDTGTIIGADNAALRHIGVTGGNSVASAFGVAMYNNNVSPRVKDVSLSVQVLSGSNGYAILNRNGASPLMEDVTAVVAGTGVIQIGVYNDDNSSPTMNRVTVEVYLGTDNRGIYNRNNSNPTMMNVSAITDQATNADYNRAIYNNGSAPLMQNVTAVARNGATQNIAVFNDAGSAPTLIDVQATASGGPLAYGIRTSNNSPLTLQGGQVRAENSNGAIGVFALPSSPITLTQTTIEATNNSNNIRGLHVQGTTAVLQGVSISVHGVDSNRAVQVQEANLSVYNSVFEVGNGGSDAGILNIAASGSYTVTVCNSQITAAIPLYSDSEFATYIGASSLNGGAITPNGGTVTCAGVYDEAFVFSASTCP